MIRTDLEYRLSKQRVDDIEQRLLTDNEALTSKGFKAAEVKRALNPLLYFQEQIQAEIEAYERLKRGEFEGSINLRDIGQLLIALRISKGVSQRELAKRLEVSESQVSRDENNEYSGISLQRINRILEALDAEITLSVSAKAPEAKAKAKPRATKTKAKGSRT